MTIFDFFRRRPDGPTILTLTDYHEIYIKKIHLKYDGKKVYIKKFSIDDSSGVIIGTILLTNGFQIQIKELTNE